MENDHKPPHEELEKKPRVIDIRTKRELGSELHSQPELGNREFFDEIHRLWKLLQNQALALNGHRSLSKEYTEEIGGIVREINKFFTSVIADLRNAKSLQESERAYSSVQTFFETYGSKMGRIAKRLDKITPTNIEIADIQNEVGIIRFRLSQAKLGLKNISKQGVDTGGFIANLEELLQSANHYEQLTDRDAVIILPILKMEAAKILNEIKAEFLPDLQGLDNS